MLQLTALNNEEVETIHQATLRILAETGVILGHPAGREMLTGEGASLRGDRLLMPPDLVERMLRRCPSQVTAARPRRRMQSTGRWQPALAQPGRGARYLRPPFWQTTGSQLAGRTR